MTYAELRPQDPARRHPPYADYEEPAIEEDGVDREPHPDRMNRAAPFEQQSAADWELVESQQPS